MTALRDVPVRILSTELRPGAWNMALDAVAAERAATDGIASVRVYGWNPSTLSLGYAQDPSTIDWNYCTEQAIHVTRRPTGGGAIYHDRVGDISYSIVSPSEVLPSDLMECYRLLCAPIISAFSRMGVTVDYTPEKHEGLYHPACYLRDLHPSHDLVVMDTTNDRKISGNAQYRRRSAIVQHGSLTFSLTPARHLGCFDDADIDEEAFRSRVTAINEHAEIAREDAIGILEDTLRAWSGAEDETWEEWEISRAENLVEDKFDSREWVFSRDDPSIEAP